MGKFIKCLLNEASGPSVDIYGERPHPINDSEWKRLEGEYFYGTSVTKDTIKTISRGNRILIVDTNIQDASVNLIKAILGNSQGFRKIMAGRFGLSFSFSE